MIFSGIKLFHPLLFIDRGQSYPRPWNVSIVLPHMRHGLKFALLTYRNSNMPTCFFCHGGRDLNFWHSLTQVTNARLYNQLLIKHHIFSVFLYSHANQFLILMSNYFFLTRRTIFFSKNPVTKNKNNLAERKKEKKVAINFNWTLILDWSLEHNWHYRCA